MLRWLHLVSGSCCAGAALANQESEVQVVERDRAWVLNISIHAPNERSDPLTIAIAVRDTVRQLPASLFIVSIAGNFINNVFQTIQLT